MTAALIAQLLSQYGPTALAMIKDLVAMWKKPELSPEEVLEFCNRHQKSYDTYLEEAKARLGK